MTLIWGLESFYNSSVTRPIHIEVVGNVTNLIQRALMWCGTRTKTLRSWQQMTAWLSVTLAIPSNSDLCSKSRRSAGNITFLFQPYHIFTTWPTLPTLLITLRLQCRTPLYYMKCTLMSTSTSGSSYREVCNGVGIFLLVDWPRPKLLSSWQHRCGGRIFDVIEHLVRYGC